MTQKYTSAGLSTLDWGYRNSSGYMLGAAATLANGSDSAMVNGDGIDAFNLQPADYRLVDIAGNDGSVGTYIFPPAGLPQGTMELGTFNSALAVAGQGTKIWTDGDYEKVNIQPLERSNLALHLVTNSLAQSRDAATLGTPGYFVEVWYNVQAVPKFASGLKNATASSFTHQLIANMSTKMPDGRLLTLANNGCTQAIGEAFFSPYPITYHSFISNASTLVFTLGHLPVAANGTKVKLIKNGTAMTYTTDYTVNISTGVVTLVAAGTAADVFEVLYQYSPTGN